MEMAWIWLIVMVFMILLEIMSFNLVTIWFALGAFITIFVSLLTGNFAIQILSFILVTTVSLLATRKFMTKIKRTDPIKTNLDAVVGKMGIVVDDIGKDNNGAVKIDNKIWTAVSLENEYLAVGRKVEIVSIQGVKLMVKGEGK